MPDDVPAVSIVDTIFALAKAAQSNADGVHALAMALLDTLDAIREDPALCATRH